MSMRMIFLQSFGKSCVVDAIIEEGMGERNMFKYFFLQSVGRSCFVDAIIEEEVVEAIWRAYGDKQTI